MPWSQTSLKHQETQFIADYLREVLSVSELCDLYGISRKTAYKWIDRYLRHGDIVQNLISPVGPSSNWPKGCAWPIRR